jgi:CheY-like chemotaxis protein
MRPDLAVVDLMMEDMDGGFVLCHRIKKLDPKIPVIMVTAVSSETGIEFDLASEKGKSWFKADALLTKPARFEQLKREIERLLKQARL